MVSVRITQVSFPDVFVGYRDIPKLRGYFARKYPEIVEFHNHEKNNFNYTFPKIQYRVINKNPTIIALNEGVNVLQKIVFQENEVVIGDKMHHINDKIIRSKSYELGITDSEQKYKFTSPWMALKEENFEKYITLQDTEKRDFLNHLIRENLKTLSKGFNYFIEDIDKISVKSWLKPLNVNFKGQKMLCFTGNFTVNFMIPDYLGLGKQTARGFGVVTRKD